LAKKSARKVTKKKATTKKKSSGAASKKSTTKTSSKKTTKKKAASSKKTTKRVSTSKKSTTKKTTKKAAARKSTAKKAAKKSVKKTAAKKTTKKKATTKKAAAKKTTKKAATKKTSKKAASEKAAPPAKADEKKDSKPASGGRTKKKKKVAPSTPPPGRPLLLGPNSPLGKGGPLIKSEKRVEASDEKKKKSRRTKSPLTQSQLDEYRQILLTKRAELVGDVEHLENEALRSSSESKTIANAAEYGTDNFDQSMNLNLAAADRRLIDEIDDALERIENKTYGLCAMLSIPIAKARLDELPWAKYSIEAARELDRTGGR